MGREGTGGESLVGAFLGVSLQVIKVTHGPSELFAGPEEKEFWGFCTGKKSRKLTVKN